MKQNGWTNSSHAAVRAERARLAFLEGCGEAAADRRAREIASLPLVVWKGRTLRTLRCNGETGRGPHDVNVPEQHLWALIDLRAFRCPYHA